MTRAKAQKERRGVGMPIRWLCMILAIRVVHLGAPSAGWATTHAPRRPPPALLGRPPLCPLIADDRSFHTAPPPPLFQLIQFPLRIQKQKESNRKTECAEGKTGTSDSESSQDAIVYVCTVSSLYLLSDEEANSHLHAGTKEIRKSEA